MTRKYRGGQNGTENSTENTAANNVNAMLGNAAAANGTKGAANGVANGAANGAVANGVANGAVANAAANGATRGSVFENMNKIQSPWFGTPSNTSTNMLENKVVGRYGTFNSTNNIAKRSPTYSLVKRMEKLKSKLLEYLVSPEFAELMNESTIPSQAALVKALQLFHEIGYVLTKRHDANVPNSVRREITYEITKLSYSMIVRLKELYDSAVTKETVLDALNSSELPSRNSSPVANMNGNKNAQPMNMPQMNANMNGNKNANKNGNKNAQPMNMPQMNVNMNAPPMNANKMAEMSGNIFANESPQPPANK
jgi:hypothetical protein